MAHKFMLAREWMTAICKAQGFDPSTVRRLVIDAHADSMVVAMYVETYAAKPVLDVVVMEPGVIIKTIVDGVEQ